MSLLKIIISLGIIFLIIGCTTAGPYVTNISSGGDSTLIIEKCKVEHNLFLDVVYTGDCYSTSLKLTPPVR